MRSILIGLFLICIGTQTWAQVDVAACAPALTKDYESFAHSTIEKQHLLWTVNETIWKDYQKEMGGSGSLFGLVKLGGSFKEFEQNRDSYFSNVDYSHSREEATQIVRMVTKERAYQAYEKCIDALASDATPSPIRVIIKSEDRETLRLLVQFKNPTNVDHSDLELSVEGGQILKVDPGSWKKVRRFGVNETVGVTVKRQTGTPKTVVTVSSRQKYPPVSVVSVRADGVWRVRVSGPIPRAAGHKEEGFKSIEMHEIGYRPGCWKQADRWCVGHGEHDLIDDPSTKLRNPSLRCIGPSPDEQSLLNSLPPQFRDAFLKEFGQRCAYMRDEWKRATLQNNDTKVHFEYGHYSRSAWVVASAEVYIEDSVDSVIQEEPFLFGTTSIARVRNPWREAASVEFEYDLNKRVMKLDDKQSGDGVVSQAGAPVNDGQRTTYTFKFNRPNGNGMEKE